MYCPHTVVYNGNAVYILRHENSDYYQGAPLAEKLNPLRYEITIHPRWLISRFTLNKGAWLNRAWSNFNWHLWKKYLVRP